MKKIKICYFTHLPNLTGSNRSLLDMLDGMDRNKVEPFVILGSHGPVEAELKKRKIRYEISFYSPATNSDNCVKNIGKHFLNTPFINRISVNKVKKILKRESIDVLHNNTYIVGVGMQAAYELKIPYICHIREFIWEDHHRKFFNEAQQEFLLKSATEVIAITKAVKQKFQPQSDKEIIVLNDGIKTDEYKLPLTEKFKDKTISILMAGRIAPGKGQMDAIKAVEELKKRGHQNLKLIIVGGIGDDKYNNQIHDYVENKQIDNVEFVEFTNDLKAIRSQCDIGLTCSKAEALGRVTIENMLSSMLVIGADTAGTLEIIRDGENGYIYRQDSYVDLADTIEKAMNSSKKSNKIIENGYNMALKKYDHQTYSCKIAKIYENIIKKSNNGKGLQ